MHHGIVAELASKTAEHGSTFLGEDFVGWRTALIVAIPAAVIYELTMALTRKMSLRLPFLILKLARFGTPKEEWEYQSQEWKAELWNILGDRERHWFLRFIDGMTFAIPLAVGGARLSAKASVKAGLKPRDAKGPKHAARHAARRRPTTTIAARAGVASGVLGMVAAGAASQQQASTVTAPSLMWWAVGILGALIIVLMIVGTFWLGVRNFSRSWRPSNREK
ncbi:hypothetical protein EDD90_2822 [Streptomyces sp. Ag109_O5-1]|uniref:hypothetical protein n=1 Tax=Streptomyces sp. Ag109_O5-1 TaxID=1938851 RepID=UPI000F4FEAB8|nr:hypothetical protein [Streptomyces sp. Ag109_O5-1]RPE39804.1 hypothetical protein EDD90_2822 [Streptomyces sp. Ag109_O5-1]